MLTPGRWAGAARASGGALADGARSVLGWWSRRDCGQGVRACRCCRRRSRGRWRRPSPRARRSCREPRVHARVIERPGRGRAERGPRRLPRACPPGELEQPFGRTQGDRPDPSSIASASGLTARGSSNAHRATTASRRMRSSGLRAAARRAGGAAAPPEKTKRRCRRSANADVLVLGENAGKQGGR